jgi:hypothetical protein
VETNEDYSEDIAALHEPVFDVEGEMWCMEFNHEFGFKECV